ncbi:RNA-directed DNA polymerase [Neomoorella thermoacetica]|uniref:RNA-directed DNA polymerase n=1 Tax=Neomoorella thermoacetica TaxID=1525 RepID=UPI0008FB51BE|nr:RNA-directed DNA polymerase [Moorella thermoacetica]OIQ60445.1 reverse transcriptase [Moorella thermoacetica]
MADNTMITLEEIFNKGYINKIWRKIKKQLPDELVRDPIDHLAYEANLEHNLNYLCYRIKNGKYIPASLTIIRAAKRDGITRSLAFLEIEDQLVLKAICERLESQLLKDFPPYVNFSRTHMRVDIDTKNDYESWFDRWLRHQTIINKFTVSESTCKFVVESDITNFFPTINLEQLKQMVLTRSNIEDNLVNLLFYLLNSFIPKPRYMIHNYTGLPQENYDASRILAHAFLKPIDDIFEEYGNKGQYARWVDDIRIAVDDIDEGKRCIAKLQQALENLSLNINSSKTRIISKEEARRELFIDLNVFLDRIHEETNKGKGNLYLSEFEKKLTRFLVTEQIGGWERILRRFYTESRRIGSNVLERFAWKHIKEFPGSASHILGYLEGRPYSQKILNELWEYLFSTANLYEDIEIRLFEFLLRWRIPIDKKQDIVIKALDYFFSRGEFKQLPLAKDYTRALISLLVFKLGGYDELLQIKRYFINSSERYFIRYAYIVLMATEQFRDDARRKAIIHEDLILRRIAFFIEELIHDPTKYANQVKNYLIPKEYKLPNRYFLDARAMPLIRILGINRKYRSNWTKLVDNIIKVLKKTSKQWRDEILINWLENERHRT